MDPALAVSWLLVDVPTVVVVEAVVSVHLLRSASSIPHLCGRGDKTLFREIATFSVKFLMERGSGPNK